MSRGSRRIAAAIAISALLCGPIIAARAEESVDREQVAQSAQKRMYPVDRLLLEYADPGPKLPPVRELDALRLLLGRTPDGLTARGRGLIGVSLPISAIGREGLSPLSGDALEAVSRRVAEALHDLGYPDAAVRAHPDDIDPVSKADRRSPGTERLRLQIWARGIREPKRAAGERESSETGIENLPHVDAYPR